MGTMPVVTRGGRRWASQKKKYIARLEEGRTALKMLTYRKETFLYASEIFPSCHRKNVELVEFIKCSIAINLLN